MTRNAPRTSRTGSRSSSSTERRIRATQAADTLEATTGWEQGYRDELAERDKKIAEFKQRNRYASPDQAQADLQLLSEAESRAARLTSDVRAANDRLVALRAQRQAQRATDAATGLPEATAGFGDGRLATAKRELQELLASYTEENPLVKRKRHQIADLVRVAPSTGARATAPNDVSFDPMSARIAAIESEIRGLVRERATENAAIATYRARIGDAPRLQQKFLDLTRDYGAVKAQYDTVATQKQQAQRSQDLERSKTYAQFQIQDRAFPPAIPYKPNLIQFVMAGIGLGLAIGGGATTVRDSPIKPCGAKRSSRPPSRTCRSTA